VVDCGSYKVTTYIKRKEKKRKDVMMCLDINIFLFFLSIFPDLIFPFF